MKELLNFQTRLNLEDYGSLQSNVVSEFTQLVNLLRAFDPTNYGILSKSSVISSLSTASPFFIEESLQAKKINIYPGVAVTKAGNIINLTEKQEFVSLVADTVNSVNLIIAEYAYTDAGVRTKQQLYESSPAPYKKILINPLKVVSLDEYNNLAVYTQERKDDIVILGVAYVNSDDILVIDLTNATYSYNRPRFSIVDTIRRDKKGSGIVSDTNPDGLSLSDLTAGSLTFFQQLKTQGLIISKDLHVPNRAGCWETVKVLSNNFKKDSSGAVTGTVNRWYLVLPEYTNGEVTVTDFNYAQNKIAVEIIKGTNILMLGINESPMDVNINYFKTKALAPSVLNDVLSFSQPLASELLFSQGNEVAAVIDPSFNLRTLGPIANNYKVFVKGDKTIEVNPVIVYPNTKVQTFTGVKTFGGTLRKPSKLIFSMKTQNGETLQFRIVGKDSNGIAITETLDLSLITPVSSLPSVYVPGQFLTTVNTYATVDTLEFIGTLQDSYSTFMLFVDYLPYLTDALPVIDFFWDGLDVKQLIDRRPIVYSLIESKKSRPLEEGLYSSVRASQSLPYSKPFIVEDFNCVQHKELLKTDSPATISTGYVTFGFDLSVLAIQDGDKLNLPNSKIMTARTSNADTTIGEFNIGTTLADMHSNFLTSLADVDFASGVTGTDLTNKIKLTINSADTNYLLTKTVVNPLSMTLEGFDYGYIAQQASQVDWLKPFLNGKYRSNSFEKSYNKFLFIGKGVESITSVKLIPCYTNRPLVWEAALSFTLVAGTQDAYILTIPSGALTSKFYIEVEGQLEGYSLWTY